MDFKVAGSPEGLTALQMDIKIGGVTAEILAQALEQARQGRMHILGKMATPWTSPARKSAPTRRGSSPFGCRSTRFATSSAPAAR